MKTSSIIIISIIVIVIIAAILYFFVFKKSTTTSNTSTNVSEKRKTNMDISAVKDDGTTITISKNSIITIIRAEPFYLNDVLQGGYLIEFNSNQYHILGSNYQNTTKVTTASNNNQVINYFSFMSGQS